MLSSFSKIAALSLTMALIGAGCVAEVRARPAYGVYTDYESYPHTVYRGRSVYYFDDGWHYRSGSGWVYLREEPDLYRYRSEHAYRSERVHNAPGAYHPRRVPERSHGREEHRRSAPSAD
jgi:hypothetical protein